MIKIILSLLVLTLLGTLQAEDKTLSYKGNASMAGTYVDSVHNKARLVKFGLEGEVSYDLTPILRSQTKAGINFVGGSSEAVYNHEYNKNSTLYLKEGFLSLNPFKELIKLDVGLIDQGQYEMKLLIGGGAFPAIVESSTIPLTKELKLKINLQQSIPNTQTHSDRLDEVKEGTPFLHLEKISLTHNNDRFKLSGELTHFEFTNLSRDVANTSRFFGNSVSGSGDLSSFIYDFAGFYTTITTNMKFGFYEIALFGDYLFNDKAPDGQNEGHRIQWQNIFTLKNSIIKIIGEYFRNEENASIGFYNDKLRGHSRRQGYALEGWVEFPKHKLKVNANYVVAKVLGSSLYTSDIHVATFKLSREF